MLWNSDEGDANLKVTGRTSKNAANFAAYINAGYDAVKAVYPKAKVIVHVDKGQNLGATIPGSTISLKENGAKVGCHRYCRFIQTRLPTNLAAGYADELSLLTSRLFLPSMATAMSSSLKSVWWWGSDQAAPLMKKMVDGCKAISTCEGIFYWEPEV